MNIESINIVYMSGAAIAFTNHAYNLVIRSYDHEKMVSACFNNLNKMYDKIDGMKERCFELSKTVANPEFANSHEEIVNRCFDDVVALSDYALDFSEECQCQSSESEASLYLPVALATGLTLLTAYLAYKKFLAVR